MSNPFDQFAVDVQSALPGGPPPPTNGFAQPPSPAPANKPAMNGAPAMNGYGQPPPQMGMGQPPMYGGAPPQPGYGAPMGGAPMGGAPMGGAPMGGAPMGGAPMGGAPMGGMAPPMPPAAPPASDPFSGFGAPPPAAVPPPAASFNEMPPQQPAPTGSAPPTPAGAPPPFMAPPAAPPTPQPHDPFAGAYGAPPAPPASDPFSAYGAPPTAPAPPADPSAGALVVSQQQSNPYAQPPPPAAPATDPFAAYGAPPPAQPAYGASPAADPFGGGYGAPPPAQPAPAPAAPPASDPFGGYGAPPPAPAAADPFGGGYGAPPPAPQQAPPPAAPVDPFSVFNGGGPPAEPQNALVPAQAPPQQQAPPPTNNDVWGDLGFGAPPNGEASTPASKGPGAASTTHNGEVPPGGEYYDARIFTPTLGVMFFKPQELTDSLFLNTDRSIVDGLGERPVVAFIVEGSSARSAGVELGHVLLKVNGVDVKNPKEASRLIKEGPRPLPLLFYVPNTDVVVAEGEHMVKYDTKDTTAPNSAKDWKPKYVVIGGIIAQPWMMNMYRSKSEYDIAVIETQARRPVSVKVKQFSLQGARIQNDWQGPQMVKYKNKLHPWKYIVILPVARNPIKISSPNLASLKPVHEGIRRVLLAQQRNRGGGHTAAARPQRSYGEQPGYSPQNGGGAYTPQQAPPQQYRY